MKKEVHFNQTGALSASTQIHDSWIISNSAMFVVMGLIGLIFYMFCSWAPMRADDYWVQFTFERNEAGKLIYSTTLISNIYDWALAWYHHRCSFSNGRLSDFVASPVLLIGGKTLFHVLNTLVFLMVIWLSSRFCFRRVNTVSVLLVAASMLLFLPRLVGTFFWICGACNYLWASLMLIIVFMVLRRDAENAPLGVGLKCLGAVCAFLCGAWHEGLAATLSAAVVMYACLQKINKKSISNTHWILITAVILGSIITLTSPAMWSRAGVGNHGILELFRNIGDSCGRLLLFSLIPLVLACVLVGRKPGSLLSPLGAFIVANLGMVIVVGYKGAWGGAYYYLNFALLLYVLQESQAMLKQYPRSVAITSSIFCALMVSVAAPHAYTVHGLCEKAISEGKTHKHVVVDLSKVGGSLPYELSQSLPAVDEPELYRNVVCARLGYDFTAFFRSCDMNQQLYAVFEGDNPQQPVIRKIQDKYVVRLPYGVKSAVSYAALIQHDGSKTRMYPSFSAYRKIFNQIQTYISGVPHGYMEKDYADGFFYLLIPENFIGYDYLHLKLNAVGEAPQELMISMPEE